MRGNLPPRPAGNITVTPAVLVQFQLPVVIQPNATILVQAPGEGAAGEQLHALLAQVPAILSGRPSPPGPILRGTAQGHVSLDPFATTLPVLPPAVAADASQRVALDWGGQAGVLEVSPGATLAFQRVISQHPAPCEFVRYSSQGWERGWHLVGSCMQQSGSVQFAVLQLDASDIQPSPCKPPFIPLLHKRRCERQPQAARRSERQLPVADRERA